MPDRSALALAGIFGVLGFLLVTSASTASSARRAAAPRQRELIELIEARRDLVDRLDQELIDIRAEVLAAQARSSERSETARAEADMLDELNAFAGTSALTGPGLEVTLRDSAQEPVAPEEAGAYRIHDRDLQLVVNALFAAGADAVSINERRIVATTPIRTAGETIVVNFRPVTSPYHVAAIGADVSTFERSDIAKRFGRWRRLFGLGFVVKERDAIKAPAFAGRVGIHTAKPVEG